MERVVNTLVPQNSCYGSSRGLVYSAASSAVSLSLALFLISRPFKRYYVVFAVIFWFRLIARLPGRRLSRGECSVCCLLWIYWAFSKPWKFNTNQNALTWMYGWIWSIHCNKNQRNSSALLRENSAVRIDHCAKPHFGGIYVTFPA